MPDADDAATVDRIIFDELVDGVFTDDSRRAYHDVIVRLGERGCDAVALACTEIPLLVRPEDSPLPTLDSTRHPRRRPRCAKRWPERRPRRGRPHDAPECSCGDAPQHALGSTGLNRRWLVGSGHRRSSVCPPLVLAHRAHDR